MAVDCPAAASKPIVVRAQRQRRGRGSAAAVWAAICPGPATTTSEAVLVTVEAPSTTVVLAERARLAVECGPRPRRE